MVELDLVSRVRAYCVRWRMFAPGDRVLVGVSGGPDSVALLDVLYRLRGELGIKIWVAHLNHLLRGRDAAGDAAYVVRLADGYGLPAMVEECNVRAHRAETGESLQVAAREVRYRFYERVAREIGARRVALGHQADDQAETILINFLRGTGMAGLAGIPPVRGAYVRPLLAERRRDIEAYCLARNLAWRTDASNVKPVYTRNRLRLELIPHLERGYNPNLVPTLLRMAEILRDEDDLLAQAAEQALPGVMRVDQGNGKVHLTRQGLLKLPWALQRRVVRRAWESLRGVGGLPFEHVERVLDVVHQSRGGRRVILPGLLQVKRVGDAVVMSLQRDGPRAASYVYPLIVPGQTAVPEFGATLVAAAPVSVDDLPDPKESAPWGTVLDLDCLAPPLVVRSRLPGDRFAPSGGGTVKLKKFLIDAKVPREHRDVLPLLVDGAGRIAWVPGLRTAAFCMFTLRTTRPLVLELRRTDGDAGRGVWAELKQGI